MMFTVFRSLVMQTIRTPREAAAQALALGLVPQASWMILMLVTVLASLFSSLMLFLLPVEDPQLAALIQGLMAYQAPVIFALLQLAQAAVGIFVLFVIGRQAGGTARPDDLVIVLVLVQVAALLLGVGIALVSLALPVIEGLGLIALLVWGIWASAAVVDVAHGFGNGLKALAILMISGAITLIVSMMVMLVLLSPPSPGGL